MGKKKKDKDKKKKDLGVEALKSEYERLNEGLRIKHEQYDALIKEAKMYVEEVKEMHEKIKRLKSTIDEK